MEVQLSPGQKAFVQGAIASGRITNEEEAVRQALLMWEERERQRVEILAAVERAQASLARGEGRRIASEPELQKNTRLRAPGASAATRLANSNACGWANWNAGA